MLRLTLTVLMIMTGGGSAVAAGVRHCPELVTPEAWQPLAADSGAVLTAADTHLDLGFTAGTPVRLLLRQPVALPDDTRSMSFLVTNNTAQAKFRVLLLVADADGAEFAYVTRADDISIKAADGEYTMVAAGHRSTEVRHRARGFFYPDVKRTIRPPQPNRKPVAPLTWIGLLVESRNHDVGAPAKDPHLYFRDFVVNCLTPNESTLYYQFRDFECLGEVDGVPYLTFGSYWWWPGRYQIAWDVRDRFAGQPFLRGGAQLTATKAGDIPLAVQLAQHLEIPVREQGTYWVRVRVQRTDEKPHFKYYDRVEQYDYRLDIMQGAPPPATRPMAPRGALHQIAIAPDRAELVYDFDEPFAVPVVLDRPGEGDWQVRIEARSTTLGDTVRTVETAVSWDETGTWSTVLDLADQPPGGYEVSVTVIGPDGQPWDLAKRVVARRGDGQDAAAPIPESVPSAAALLGSDEPMFHLDATYYTDRRLDNPREAWEKGFKPFLDEAGTISKDIEFTVFWKLAEPLPGVYDWNEVDRFLDYAQTKGLRVLLRLDFRGPAVPEWIPGRFVRTQEGYAFGHTAYLFHGMQPNFFYAPDLRWQVDDFLLAAVRHFRGHPAVQGYYYVAEHPGDAPWNGFFSGFSADTVRSFRAWLHDRYGSLTALNAACGTRLPTWAAIDPPGTAAPPRFRLAWLTFRDEVMDEAKRAFVTGMRRIDPTRLVMLYSTREGAKWFADHGCMTANGGTHAAHMPGYLAMALEGFQMRNEAITPRAWSGTGPFQLDDTVFHAAVAGPAHTHCKAFIATWERFADCQDPPRSLGKYQRFQEIWRELRRTEPPTVETYAFVDRTSFLLEQNAVGVSMTPGGWPVENAMAANLWAAMDRGDRWQHGKLVIATGQYVEHLEPETIAALVAYVKGGGCLYMRADAGRHDIARPAEDWVLLRQLGFLPPAQESDGGYREATTTTGQRMKFRECWTAPAAGETLATFAGGDAPAVSRLVVGQGQVVVRWARTAVPALHGGGHSILSDVADLAGVRRLARTDHSLLGAYLLKARDADLWYGLVTALPWYGAPEDTPVVGHVRWPYLPDGSYRVREWIHERDLGIHPAAELREIGLPLSLKLRETAVFKLELVNP